MEGLKFFVNNCLLLRGTEKEKRAGIIFWLAIFLEAFLIYHFVKAIIEY